MLSSKRNFSATRAASFVNWNRREKDVDAYAFVLHSKEPVFTNREACIRFMKIAADFLEKLQAPIRVLSGNIHRQVDVRSPTWFGPVAES